MSDNIFWICFFCLICIVILIITFFIYDSNKEYNKKIVSIHRHEYIFKYPSGRVSETKDLLEFTP